MTFWYPKQKQMVFMTFPGGKVIENWAKIG